VPHQTEADGSERWTQHATGRSVEHSCCDHNDKDWPQSQYKGANTDADDRQGGRTSNRANGIDDRPAGHLSDQANQTPDRENKTDIGQRPLLRRQVDRDERAKTGLHVRHEENEPIESAKAGA
jgi:hypothetical protein